MAVVSFLDRQVDILVENVKALAASRGYDLATAKKVRAAVAADLLNPEKSKLNAALERLAGTNAAECLQQVIADCRQHFDLGSRSMSVLIAPVAVRLRTRKSTPVSIQRAGHEDLNTLSLLANARLGSKKVVFDRRIYSAADLANARSAQLLELGQALLRDEADPDVGMSSYKLLSNDDWAWEMVYLLGFEERDPGDTPVANEAETQAELHRWLCYAETAISQVDQILFDDDVEAEVKPHGIWYAAEGLKRGEDLIRAYRVNAR